MKTTTTLVIVSRHVNGLLQTDRLGQEEFSDEWCRKSGQRIAAQMLPIADPHGFQRASAPEIGTLFP